MGSSGWDINILSFLLCLFYFFSHPTIVLKNPFFIFKKKLNKFFNTKYMQMTFVCYLEDSFFFHSFSSLFSLCVLSSPLLFFLCRLPSDQRKTEIFANSFVNFFLCKKEKSKLDFKVFLFFFLFFLLMQNGQGRKECFGKLRKLNTNTHTYLHKH